jgi:ligand-binding SRPBCC domain-containing protein
MTRIHLRAVVPAPIDEVFAFFDDPDNTAEFNEHAESIKLVEVQADGRRTVDVVMKAGQKTWMQTVKQVVRERPTRLVTRGGSWTTDRNQFSLSIMTDRRFQADGDDTAIDVTIEYEMQHSLRRPVWAILGWLQRGAAQREFEYQLTLMVQRLASRGHLVT